jgi:phosphoglucomutase
VKLSPLAGQATAPDMLVNVPRLVTAYYTDVPDPSVPEQRVAFGTSGHRGSAFEISFNEWHVLAISQAICDYRAWRKLDGPLFLGMDTHALSVPACASALEVLAANGVQLMLAEHDEYTPTPAVSHAILTYNRGRSAGLADGIVVTPSHNPPDNGGFKYNPANGGPADNDVTGWIEARANAFLERGLDGVKKMPHEKALRAATTHRYDYLNAYVGDLGSVLDMDAIRGANIRMGVDPLGGAGVHYWGAIAQRYAVDLTVVNEVVDPTFRYDRVEAPGATLQQKQMLAQLAPQQVRSAALAGEKIEQILTRAPGNDAPIGGLKVIARSGWFAARPSGTENIYRIHAESWSGADHLQRVLAEAQAIVGEALAT